MSRCGLELLRRCVSNLRWTEASAAVHASVCDLVWVGQNPDTIRSNENLEKLSNKTRVNRFDGMASLCNKDACAMYLKRMKTHFPEYYSHVPQTFVLPNEREEFNTHFDKHKTYIVKPTVGSEGNGIYLMQKKKDLRREQKECVIQEYIANPMLMEGFKFDLRLYVLVCSVDPLRVYLCREGLVRLATVPYQKPTQQNVAHSYMHLTNATLNKHNTDAYEHGGEGGSKRQLSALFGLLLERGFDPKEVWASIHQLVATTMLALQPAAANQYKNTYPDACPTRPKTTVRRFQVRRNPRHNVGREGCCCNALVGTVTLIPPHTHTLSLALFLSLSLSLSLFPPSFISGAWLRRDARRGCSTVVVGNQCQSKPGN
jgi:hypothetical protein